MILLVLLILPVALAGLVFLVKSKWLNFILNIAYALFFLGASISFAFARPVFGDYLGLDSLNLVFFIILAILYLGVAIYNVGYFKDSTASLAHETNYFVFSFLFIFAMTGFLLSRHLGLMWVFIEATTLATTYLIDFNKSKASLDAAWKYIFTCSIGIAFAFVGIIFLSKGAGGSADALFFENIYRNAHSFEPFFIKLGFAFILLGFGTKMGLAPMHAWLPDAHSEAPSPISALLSGTLLNMACLGILRVYKLMFLADQAAFANILLLILGFLSLFFSAAFIPQVKNYKKMLAYSSVENMGIIAIGVALGGVGLFAAIFHLIGHSLTKASFFLTAGNIMHRYDTKEVDEVKGLLKDSPRTGWLWFLSFVSLIGLPPFPLFISEFLIVKQMVIAGWILPIILFFLLLTIIMFGLGSSVFRMIFGANQPTTTEPRPRISLPMLVPQITFLILLVVIGISLPPKVYEMIQAAANYLINA